MGKPRTCGREVILPSGMRLRCTGHVRGLYSREGNHWVRIGEWCDNCPSSSIERDRLRWAGHFGMSWPSELDEVGPEKS
jgi:hypothetical protein